MQQNPFRYTFSTAGNDHLRIRIEIVSHPKKYGPCPSLTPRGRGLQDYRIMSLHWKDLKVWQKVHQLVLEVYRVTASFPKTEIYGVTSQLRRAAASVPANIAEGQSRQTTKEYLQFLYNARGSLEEVRYFLLLSYDLKFLTLQSYNLLEQEYNDASKMLNALIKSLKKQY